MKGEVVTMEKRIMLKFLNTFIYHFSHPPAHRFSQSRWFPASYLNKKKLLSQSQVLATLLYSDGETPNCFLNAREKYA
jgi:hypothetical protein